MGERTLNMKKIIPNDILLPEVAQLIETGHSVTITVRGNSMNPFLTDRRDRVTLGSFAPDDLQPGVAVLARDTTGRFVFHRIISRNNETLILQGDGNVAQTEETSVDQVLGIMTEAIRKEKPYPANGKVWKRYSYWWLKVKPLRRYLLAVYRRI